MAEARTPAAPACISIRGAREHNLKNISVDIPRDKLVVITGLSGSGKSSLAFDTIYAEGQRRYVESLSSYARQFLEQMEKPDVEYIEGLPPTISIEQRSGAANPRSTVATTTEIYDYLRLLYARAGTPYCYKCGRPIGRQTPEQIVQSVLSLGPDARVMVLAPLVRGRKGEHREVFLTIKREGFVRARVDGTVLDAAEPPKLDKNKKHEIEAVVDRLEIRDGIRSRLHDSVEAALGMGEGIAIVAEDRGGKWRDHLFSERYACPKCNISVDELSPRMFSFNSPYGACPKCDGLGVQMEFDPDLLVPDKSLSLDAGAIQAWRGSGHALTAYYQQLLLEFARDFDVDTDVPFANLPKEAVDILLHGTNSQTREKYGRVFEGVLPELTRRFERSDSESIKERLMQFMSELPCPSCKGARLRPEVLAVRIADKAIHQVCALTVDQAHAFFRGLRLTTEQQTIAHHILKEIIERLSFMVDVGISYLTLDRSSATLAGGELQRIRLATQVGSGLVGVCYVLDEPTIGLHQKDNEKLIRTLLRLRDLGNSVIVVEHDEETIRRADFILDLGPGAGDRGGEIVAQGSLADILACEPSLTGQYLNRKMEIETPPKRRPVDLKNAIELYGACENNLKAIDVRIPLGTLCCVTGVSGSGKSTLVVEVLRKALARQLYGSKEKPGAYDRIAGVHRIDKVIEIDQSPIGRTPRSNAATYTNVFNHVRALYAQTREARIRGYEASRFSFNVKGGRCEACEGQGTKKIEMHFLPDLFVTCEQCKGTRYNRETLEIKYRGKNIADVLNMRVEEAHKFFENFPHIKRLLGTLHDVGLGYLALGQSSTTLSGGEAQRIKLSAELGKQQTGRTLYILDEPTTGLHFADISNLLRVLNRLIDLGNTVLVIEHNLDVIKTADCIIDLGPEGGEAGGEVVATGTPEEVAANERSHTGKYLRRVLRTR